MNRIGQQAVVIGASMGGLLAARILADYFEQVTLLERDSFPAIGENRKGVPQGRHAHGLQARGRVIIEQLFPGVTQEMVAQGGLMLDVSRDFRWYADGGFHVPATSGLDGLLISRARLEGGVRARLLALPNVNAIEQCDVNGLVFSADQTRVTGVRVVRRAAGGSEETLSADLVIDASGRGSQSAVWLAEAGYQKPVEERVRIDLTYTTCVYRRSADQLQGRGGLAVAGAPPIGRNGVVLAQEGDRWIVTIGGFNGDMAPLDQQGFLEFARKLPTPEIYELIKHAEPLGEPYFYRFAANQRRRYEYLKRFPEGYLVFGDAICSFNPVYGQGMTVAASEAIELQACLEQGTRRLAQRFFKAAGKVVDGPWRVAVGNDMRLPHVDVPRTRIDQFINWYFSKLHVAAQHDATVSVAFLKVANMIAHPSTLLNPAMALRILRGNLAERRQRKLLAQPIAVTSFEI